LALDRHWSAGDFAGVDALFILSSVNDSTSGVNDDGRRARNWQTTWSQQKKPLAKGWYVFLTRQPKPRGRSSCWRSRLPKEAPARHPDTAWYVIHSYSGYEKQSQKEFGATASSRWNARPDLPVVVPTEEEVELRTANAGLPSGRLPRVILVEMVMNDDTWYVVRNTAGA